MADEIIGDPKSPRAVQAERHNRTSWLLSGDPNAVADGLTAVGCAFQWSTRNDGYLVPVAVVDRVVVAIERAGHRVDVRSGLW